MYVTRYCLCLAAVFVYIIVAIRTRNERGRLMHISYPYKFIVKFRYRIQMLNC